MAKNLYVWSDGTQMRYGRYNSLEEACQNLFTHKQKMLSATLVKDGFHDYDGNLAVKLEDLVMGTSGQRDGELYGQWFNYECDGVSATYTTGIEYEGSTSETVSRIDLDDHE